MDGPCILDLEFATTEPPELHTQDNNFSAGACGGMNVSFRGKWVESMPRSPKKLEKR